MSKRITELKPCPFCGGTAHIKYYAVPGYYIDAEHTKTCGVKPNTQSLPSKVLRTHIKKWNTRTVETFIKPIGTPNQIRALYNLPPIDEYSKYDLIKKADEPLLRSFHIHFVDNAYEVRDIFDSLMRTYGFLTMEDLCDMLGIKSTCEDRKIGWDNPDDIWVEITDDQQMCVKFNEPEEF